MSNSLPSSSCDDQYSNYLHNLLESARPFLQGELEKIDPEIPSLVAVLKSVGAGECWHSHGSFLQHLIDVYRILKLWGASDVICLCGLMHSSYSNSYVNLTLFDRSTDRDTVRAYVGDAAESLIHLFCVVPKKTIIYDDLLFHYSDSELIEHLEMSQKSLLNVKEKGLSSRDEKWRLKINSLVPEDGVVVKHFKTGEDVRVSRRNLAIFVLMTIADVSEQHFDLFNVMFENTNGRRELSGSTVEALWPGDVKPGLCMNSLSRLGAVYMLIVREEEIMIEERKRMGVGVKLEGRDEDIELVIPPVFNKCTQVLDAEEQIKARDMYWEAVCDYGKIGLEKTEELLLYSIEKNPFVGEPHVVLGQLYLIKGRFKEAEREVERGLTLLLEWGSPWDKRMSWEGWIAWTRVLLIQSKERSWPQTAWGIMKLGLVR